MSLELVVLQQATSMAYQIPCGHAVVLADIAAYDAGPDADLGQCILLCATRVEAKANSPSKGHAVADLGQMWRWVIVGRCS